MFGLGPLGAAGIAVLAAGGVECSVPKPPEIIVTPSTAPIQYEFSLTSEELGRFQTNTVNPYAPGTDTATGGLRHDRPRVTTRVAWGVREYRQYGAACLWYDKITVEIALSPKIYIADDMEGEDCREAIMEHEEEHVSVDRDVINSYAQAIGLSVKNAVDGAGAMGPYNLSQIEDIRGGLVKHIETAVESRSFYMYQEMTRRQSEVDSLEEYKRISDICNGR